jgi:Heat induced stress protein YflT domain
MSNVEPVAAVYHTHSQAEQAVKELQRAGVDMHSLSIVAKDYHTDEQVVGTLATE